MSPLARRVGVAYERVHSSVVFIQGFRKNGSPLWRKTGVIVTPEGLVLCTPGPAVSSLKVTLPDGRQTGATIIGQSTIWNLSVMRLAGPGPWPHIKLVPVSGGIPGQAVITLGYPETSREADPLPWLRLERVIGSVPSAWFDTTGEHAREGWSGEVVFDTEGMLLGVGNRAWYGTGHRFYTHANVIRSLWAGMSTGKDVDRELLWPASTRVKTRSPFARNAAISPGARKKAILATVRLREADEPERSRGFRMTERHLRWSGVIVSADGLIVTCAHHLKMPGTELSIYLADGRLVRGRVLGIHLQGDIGLVKITSRGTWPHVSPGDSRRLAPGSPCLAVGYPDDMKPEFAQPPAVSTGVAGSSDFFWYPGASHLLRVTANRPYPPALDGPNGIDTGGMSGGGIFDPEGRLVGTMVGGNDVDGAYSTRVELVRANRKTLLHPEGFLKQTRVSALETAEDSIRKSARMAKRSVVVILKGKQPVAYGTIVSPDGHIVTLASVLPTAPYCRLPDGRITPATILHRAPERDVAVLKITKQDQLPLRFGAPGQLLSPGELVALPVPDGVAIPGTVSCPLRSGREEQGNAPGGCDIGIGSDLELPGGPVVDMTGRMCGLVLSSSASGWVRVLPSWLVRAIIRDS